MCEIGNLLRNEAVKLAVKILIMIILSGRHVMCFIISSEVKHDTLIYSYCELGLYVEGWLAVVTVCEHEDERAHIST